MAGQTPGSAGKGIKKVFSAGLTETADYDKEGVGAIRFEGQKIYKWVKYNNGSGDVASVVGNFAYYYGVAGDAVTGGYENSVVTMDLTDGYLTAGVFQAIIADGEFGWIQIQGPATVTTAFKAGADVNTGTMVGATTDGTLDVCALVTDEYACLMTDVSAKKCALTCPF